MSSRIDTVDKNEYPTLLELWEASVRATHHFLKEEDIAFFKPLILNEYLHAVELRCTRNEEKKITGFSGVNNGNLEMLFIHPDYFGQKLGTHLLKHSIEQQQVTRVDVNEQNEQATAFYLAQGFEQIGRSEVDGMGKPYPLLHMKYAP